MQRKKGFTLIELLAVIVILGVIALIATPTVFYLIEKARMEAFKDSVINSFSSLDYYLIQTKGKGTFEAGIANGISIDELDLKDDFTKGSFVTATNRFGEIPEGGVISYYIQNERYCSYGLKKNLKVAKKVNGNCFSLDETGPDFDGFEGKYKKTVSSNRITLYDFAEDFAFDLESGVIGYVIRIYDGDEQVGEKVIDSPTIDGAISFNGLKAETTYRIEIEAENGNHKKSSITLPDITTLAIVNPVFSEVKDPNQHVEGYLKKQIVTITFSSENIDEPIYYIQTRRKGISNNNVVEKCGEGVMPRECSSESTKELQANVWYRVSGNISITYQENTNESSTIIAYTSDGNNYAGGSAHHLFKIDNQVPELVLKEATTTSNSAIIPIQTFTDSGVGPAKITSCKYGTSNGSYTNNGSISVNSSCTLSGLKNSTTYYYQVCGQDKLGNATCKTGNTASKDIVKPEIVLNSTPTKSINSYVKSQVATITFNSANITSPSYYVKTGRVGTSSVAVTESYGSGTTPGSKTTISSTTTLSANTWYKVSSNMTITYTGNASDQPSVYAMISDGTNYVSGTSGTLFKLDNTGPNLVLGTATTTSNSAIIPIQTFTDGGVGPANITSCKYGTTNGSYTSNGSISENSSCTLSGLKNNTTYYYQVCGQDKLGNATCKTGNTASKDIVKPEIVLNSTPTKSINSYVKSQVATITFNSANITSPSYYVKTGRVGTSSVAITESYGSGTTPGSKTTISSTTTLSANTWYKVSSNMTITYTGNASDQPSVYAMISDGTNYVSGTSGTLFKLDNTGPNLVLGTASTTTDKIVVPITQFKDNEVEVPTSGGITSCKYGTTSGSYTNTGTINGNTGCMLTGLNQKTTYYYQVCGQDNLGNSTCRTGNATTQEIAIGQPGVRIVSTPPNSIGGFYDKQIAKVTFSESNTAGLTYYVKSSKPGTLNVNTTGICGNGNSPSACSSSTTRTLTEGYWYRVGSNTAEVSYTDGYYNTTLETLNVYVSNGISYKTAVGNLSNIFYLASNVTYTNNGQSTVQGALDDLYTKLK